MKKVLWVAALALTLAYMPCAPALAQTTGIAMDGKVYTFAGGEGTYQADGKTFIIGEKSVVVQEPGRPDRVLDLVHTDEQIITVRQSMGDSVAICEGTAAFEVSEAISLHKQYSCVCAEGSNVRAERFEPYAKYGLSYNPETGILIYQGQRVRRFLDIRQSNGEALNNSRFHGCITSIDCSDNDPGEVDIEVIRDYTQPDANGDGALIGVIAEKVR